MKKLYDFWKYHKGLVAVISIVITVAWSYFIAYIASLPYPPTIYSFVFFNSLWATLILVGLIILSAYTVIKYWFDFKELWDIE